MRNFLPVVFLLSLFKLSIAQDEQLTNLKINPALYAQTKKFQPGPSLPLFYLVSKGNTIITTDTLALPFIDDFSTNREPSFLYVEHHTVDSFFNVLGGCLLYEGINTTQGLFMTRPTWLYHWDVGHQRLDSTVQRPWAFTDFGTATSGCFANTPVTELYWPAYNTYTFDSASGLPLDSAIFPGSGADTVLTLNYAPVVYFATGQHGTLWFDNYAFINNTYPINPPTIGVATLDGLNEYGLPYSNVAGSYGTADYLTSNPIDLSSHTPADSVYLSFFFEPKGNGDYPDYVDSLILEFKDNSGTWRIMWSDTGYLDPSVVPDTFKQVIIKVDTITNPYSFYYSTFQFRFRNKASLYGNNNHWHIDYVKMDQHRSYSDTIIHDMAFVYPFPSILKNFTQLPAVQFSGQGDLADTLPFIIHNLDPSALTNPPATNFAQDANQTYPAPALVSTQQLQTFNAAPSDALALFPANNYTIPAVSTDSFSITSRVYINPNDSRAQNDTLYHTQSFSNIMAYDDGSAEKAYGLTGLDVKKFGYEFIVNKPDTLVGFQVMFTTVETDVHDLVFNYEAWDSLRFNDVTFVDSPVLSILNQTPFYIDSLNGFATYKLDTPIIVTHKIYFGWAQFDERRLQIGYDINSTLGRAHMFIYTQGTWKPSTIATSGSPMIRLIFDSSFVGPTSMTAGLKTLTDEQERLDVFPNPTSGELTLKSNLNNSFEIYVTDALGRTALHWSAVKDHLDLSELQSGIYLLVSRDLQTGKTYRNKVIKTTF